MEAGGRAMHGAIAEESYLVAKDKISPVVEMTRACHSNQRYDLYGQIYCSLQYLHSPFTCGLYRRYDSTDGEVELRLERQSRAMRPYKSSRCRNDTDCEVNPV